MAQRMTERKLNEDFSRDFQLGAADLTEKQ